MTDIKALLERAEAELRRHDDRYEDPIEELQLMVEIRMTLRAMESHRNELPEGAKLLFLDLDGVMNDHRRHPCGYSPILGYHVFLLNALLDMDRDILIVLSSAWRTSFPTIIAVETLLGCHGVHSKDRIHGVTELDPELWHPNHAHARDWEYWSKKGLIWRKGQIERYLSRYQRVPYVVLDDLPLDMENLVQTDPHIGMTEEDMVRVLNMFSVQSLNLR